MDNIFGVTPIESAFEVIGLTNSYAITNYIFRGSGWGSLFLCIGFFISLYKFYNTNSFAHIVRFFVIVFILTAFFILPATLLGNITSTMESQGGYKQIKAQDIVSSSTSEITANSGLAFTSRLINNLVLGIVGVTDNLTGAEGFNYLNSPFLMNKIMLQMQSFVSAPITDQALKNQVRDFINTYYLPTLNKMEEDGLINSNNTIYLWPGKGFVVSNYTEAGKAAWEDLKPKLVKYIEQSGFTKRYQMYVDRINKLQNSNPIAENKNRKGQDKDLLIIALFNKEFIADSYGREYSLATQVRHHKENATDFDNISENIQGTNNTAAGILSQGLEYVAHFFTSVGLQFFLIGLPYIQGLLVLLLFSMFPTIIILCIFTSTFKYMGLFLKSLIYIKSWHIVLSIISNGSRAVLEVQARLMPDSSFVVDRPIYNIILFLFMIASPVFSYFLITGALEGVGGVTSSLMAVGGAASAYTVGKFKQVTYKVIGKQMKNN